MILYDYFRSTACYRVRIAMNLKNIAYEKVEVHLVNDGGQQNNPDYLQINPQGLVPALNHNGLLLNQSMAIIDYLDDLYPDPPLLPADPFIRAKLKSIAYTVTCDMHPLNNLRVLNRLKSQFHAKDEQVNDWYHHWLGKGFEAIEKQLEQLNRTQSVCYGKSISLADICLIPQVYNATRFQFDMSVYPLIQMINEHCLSLDAFKKAAP